MQISERLILMSARGDIAPMSSKDALAIEEALSALEPQERDGWKLLPVEPTEEMKQAVAADWGRRTWEQYAAVIAAAPPHTEGK